MVAKTPQQQAAVERLRRWALGPEGQARFQWEAPGAFRRCQLFYKGKVPGRMIDGWCAELHHEATGEWPGEHKNES